MPHYSVAEAKNRLPFLLKAAASGEEVVITRRGEPVATINPVVAPRVPVAVALERLRVFRESMPQTGVDWVDAVREMRDEERF